MPGLLPAPDFFESLRMSTNIDEPREEEKTQPSGKIDFSTRLVLTGVALGIFMGALESTIVGTAMPTVIAILGGIDIYSWVAVAYMLTSTLMTPIWGKTADMIGRRPAMFGGLALFLIGSFLSGMSHSMAQLITFRALQGLGAGALFPVGMTIVGDLLPLEKRTKTIALFSGMWGVASLFGPLAGGYLTEHLSWRWVFFINLPFGLLAGVLIWSTYTEKHGRSDSISIDYYGTIVLSLGLTLLLLVVERGSSLPVYLSLAGLILVGLMTALFIRIEHKAREPLIPMELFRERMVIATTLHGVFAGMMLFGSMLYLPLFVQAVLGTSPTAAGQILTPLILSWVASAITGGRLLLRVGYRRVVLPGMLLMITGAALLAAVSPATTRGHLTVAAIFLGLGGGLTLASLMIGAQHAVPRTRLGVVTSTVQFSRSIGAALGISVMGAMMSWNLKRILSSAGGEFSSLSVGDLDVASLVRASTRASLSPKATQFLEQALATSIQRAFILGLIMVVIAAGFSLLIPSGTAHHLVHPEHHSDPTEDVGMI